MADRKYYIRISLDNNFIKDKNANDLLWAWLYINSFYDNLNSVRYIPKNKVKYKDVSLLLNKNEKTIKKHFKYFVDNNMILFDDKKKYYILNDTSEKYIMISYDIANMFILSGINNALKVYCILLNYNKLKGNSYFTQSKLLESIGYNKKSNNNNHMIKDILEYLLKYNLIKYRDGGKFSTYKFIINE